MSLVFTVKKRFGEIRPVIERRGRLCRKDIRQITSPWVVYDVEDGRICFEDLGLRHAEPILRYICSVRGIAVWRNTILVCQGGLPW